MNVSPDAIAVLAAGVKPNDDGTWSSTDLTAADDRYGAPGGKLRILAAAVLAERYPAAVVVSGGAQGFESPDRATDRPSLAAILGRELVAAGVPRERLVLEERSNSTFQELSVLAELAAAGPWRAIAIVTNRWHVERVRVMLRARFARLEAAASVSVCAAEDVLVAANPHEWRTRIDGAYASPFLQARIARERQGIAAITAGVYDFR